MLSLSWWGHWSVHQQPWRYWAASITSVWRPSSERDRTTFQLCRLSAQMEQTNSNNLMGLVALRVFTNYLSTDFYRDVHNVYYPGTSTHHKALSKSFRQFFWCKQYFYLPNGMIFLLKRMECGDMCVCLLFVFGPWVAKCCTWNVTCSFKHLECFQNIDSTWGSRRCHRGVTQRFVDCCPPSWIATVAMLLFFVTDQIKTSHL